MATTPIFCMTPHCPALPTHRNSSGNVCGICAARHHNLAGQLPTELPAYADIRAAALPPGRLYRVTLVTHDGQQRRLCEENSPAARLWLDRHSHWVTRFLPDGMVELEDPRYHTTAPHQVHRIRITPLTPPPPRAETDRQVQRLYDIAYRVARIAGVLTNPQADARSVDYAMARTPRGLSAGRRLLALPDVAEHPETPYALARLKTAEQKLNAPATGLLLLAVAAGQAAARADQADDDLRTVVFRDIERRCRHLVEAAEAEPVLGYRGWTARDRATCEQLHQQATQWGLTPTPGAGGNEPATQAGDDKHPEVRPDLAWQATQRAVTRARCTAGIRCTEPNCLTYGATKTTQPGMWLCADCFPKANARLAARGHTTAITPVTVPDDARYTVRLFNASGRDTYTITCDTPQRAQFLAETERPYNNTGHEIEVHPTPQPAT